MIDGRKQYPAMKESGVPWPGQVPEHWEVLPNQTSGTPRSSLAAIRRTTY